MYRKKKMKLHTRSAIFIGFFETASATKTSNDRRVSHQLLPPAEALFDFCELLDQTLRTKEAFVWCVSCLFRSTL